MHRYHHPGGTLRSFFVKHPIAGFIQKLFIPFVGLASLIWFLIRVIPKPSRATYPCMRVAAPLASGFVAYLIGLTASILAFWRAKKRFYEARYLIAGCFLLIGILTGIWTMQNSGKPAMAFNVAPPAPSNAPIGEANGIFPGRVVWTHNPDATNEKFVPSNSDACFLDKNNDMAAIDKMVSQSILNVAGKSDEKEAWDAIFNHFNQQKHGIARGYKAGEKIFIKINVTSAWGFGETWGNIKSSDYSVAKNSYYGMVETSPHVVLAFLRQLVNKCGVAQENISVGDPMKHIYKHCWDLWTKEFPKVKYIDHDAKLGRVQVKATDKPVIFYSDKGKVLRISKGDPTPVLEDKLYTVTTEADYMINIASLKGHVRGGITLCAKNHFGSQARADAAHLHYGLVSPEDGVPLRDKMRSYRIQVDIMGNKYLGGNTLLFVIDGLWTARHELKRPVKWNLPPFNGDYPSSILMSQDQVALESVCYDFLKAEFKTGEDIWAQMAGTNDYLMQAADKAYWPDGIVYDPDNDGTPIGSLGVYEHWNNEKDKQYSRNLGTGKGIELVYVNSKTAVREIEADILPDGFTLSNNFPNPFNPSTSIEYTLPHSADVKLEVYNLQGQLVSSLAAGLQSPGNHQVVWDGRDMNDQPVVSGTYMYRLTANGNIISTKTMSLIK